MYLENPYIQCSKHILQFLIKLRPNTSVNFVGFLST